MALVPPAHAARAFAYVAVLLPVAFAGTASGQIPSALRLEPRGAYAAGTTTTFKAVNGSNGHNEYHFKYDGTPVHDETIEYVIDVDDSSVQMGLIRVFEKTTGSLPIKEGGFTWRTAAGTGLGNGYDTPRVHAGAAGAALFHEYLDPTMRTLTLKYKETRVPSGGGSVEARKSYEFWIVGKALKIHAYGDGSVNKRFIDNYDFLQPGASALTIGAHEQQIPYMDNTPVVCFHPTPTTTAFYAISDDYYSSAGAMGDWTINPSPQPPDTFEHWYPVVSLPNSHVSTPPYEVLAVPDETLNLIVTSKIEDTFTVVPNYRSPYYAVTSGRMMIFGSSQVPGSWSAYQSEYEEFKKWGLADLTIVQYMSKRLGPTGILFALDPSANSAGIMGCKNIVRSPIPDPSTGNYSVDPNDATNLANATAEFGALKDSARDLGSLFAAIDCESGMDQWGTHEVKPPGIAANVDYPINRPLHIPGWTLNGIFDLGLMCNAIPTAFNPAWVVRDETGALLGNWDVGQNLHDKACTWFNWGYRVGTVDANYACDLVTLQLQFGRDNYRANAVNYDASHAMPDGLSIDRTYENPLFGVNRTHSAGDYLKLRLSANRRLRTYIGGPMYGEANHWRDAQCYEYGVRDGFRDNFPTGDLPGGNWNVASSWVVPDYNLREVLPKAAGNSGMGWEGMQADNVQFPVDGDDGNSNSYLDSYITTSATYGQNGYTGTNGRVSNNYITDEGILRQYAYLEGLSRRMREGKLVKVTYYSLGLNPVPYDLSSALAAGIDLKNSRIRIEFDDGLVFYANHDVLGGSDWKLPSTVPILNTGLAEQLTISPNGFAAGDKSQLYVFFNGKPSGWAASLSPFDYVKYANRWEAITNRGLNSNHASGYTGYLYNNFPPTTVVNAFSLTDLDLFSEATIYVDARLNVAVGAHGGLWDVGSNGWVNPSSGDGLSKVTVANLGAAPAPQALTLSSNVSTIYTNKPEGVSARFTYGNGAWQDVTTLSTWSTTNGVVDQSGAITAANPGSTTVIAKYTAPGGTLFTQTLTLPVVDGLPSANAGPDLTVYPGTAVSFDASSAADPKGGPVRCDWDFGDGTKAVGTKVDHVFTEAPATARTVTLAVRDVEENVRSDSAAVTVKWNNTTYWWDNFDDGVLDGYSQVAGDLWGVRAGLLQQSNVASAYQELTVSGTSHVFGDASNGVEFKMISPSGANNVGLHVHKYGETDLPTTSGYSVVVDGTGLVTLSEAGSGGAFATGTIAGFSASSRHDLRVVTKLTVPSGPIRVRAYVDGVKIIEKSDSTPQQPGYTGLITYHQKSQFDDLRITDGLAPYITAYPLEYVAATATTFWIDDQDLFSKFRLTDPTSMVFTIKAEDGPNAGQTLVYNGWTGANSLASIATPLSYEPGGVSNATWAKVTMGRTVETTMNNFGAGTNSISYEMVVHDTSSPNKYTRKFVRYTRP